MARRDINANIGSETNWNHVAGFLTKQVEIFLWQGIYLR
jgi:hypothetical protein